MTDDKPSKPREFWIYENNRGPYHYAQDKKDDDQLPDFHVIEKSAADKLAAVLEFVNNIKVSFDGKKYCEGNAPEMIIDRHDYEIMRDKVDEALEEYRGEK